MKHESAHTLIARLASRQVSALELCDQAIARIEALDGPINAVVVRDFERAREQARTADAALARGERRALLGLPMTVKEAFDVAGLTTTWGIRAFREHRPAQDAVMVARLKAAGAVILGKTNVATALADWQSVNPLYGRTGNPHDTSRSAGGSSGGSAAALASGMVSLELGSDIGGSIRVPSHLCGVYGHKPSHGLLPARGHCFPGSAEESNVLNVVGPMANHPADLALALDVLAGPDESEAVGYRLALPAPRHTRLADFRVLVLDDNPDCATDSEVRAGVTRVADLLARAGAKLVHHHPLLPDLGASYHDYQGLLGTITTRGSPEAQPPLDAHVWLDLLDRRQQVRAAWRRLFGEIDVVLAPVFGTAAFPHVLENDWMKRTLTIDGRSTPYHQQLAWPGVATYPGLPATAVPAGRTAQGLPTGVQLIGPYLEDRTTIALAQLLQSPG